MCGAEGSACLQVRQIAVLLTVSGLPAGGTGCFMSNCVRFACRLDRVLYS